MYQFMYHNHFRATPFLLALSEQHLYSYNSLLCIQIVFKLNKTFQKHYLIKSLTRYRFDKVKERAKLNSSISRLVCILFPELEKLVPTLHMASVYAMLSEFPGAKHVANAHLTRLTNLLSESSKGRYGKETAITFRDAARSTNLFLLTVNK